MEVGIRSTERPSDGRAADQGVACWQDCQRRHHVAGRVIPSSAASAAVAQPDLSATPDFDNPNPICNSLTTRGDQRMTRSAALYLQVSTDKQTFENRKSNYVTSQSAAGGRSWK